MKKPNKLSGIRKTELTAFGLLLVILLTVNIIGGFLFTRFDLTSEKRFTLSQPTRDLLKKLDDHVFFKIYLEGDFPAGFKKLSRETKELLDEFRAYNKFISYEFIDPLQDVGPSERGETIKALAERGLNATELQMRTSSGTEQKLIFPGALVMYRDREFAVDLLENQLNASPDAVLNNSIQNLEFKLADVIRKLSQLQKPQIAFIEGHGELTAAETHDLTLSLQQNYLVERLAIDGQISVLTRRSEPDSKGEVRILPNYAAIVIARPTQAFNEKDKFIIDQYVMYGGKVLWLIDPVNATMDSLQINESTIGVDMPLNIDDQLFKYGLRFNKNLVLDINSASIPLRTGQVGGQAQIEFFRWPYFPLLNQASEHPVVRNINSLKADFVSSADTVEVALVNKTPLLKTSDYSRMSGTPALISLAMLREQPDQRQYNRKGQIVAWLLEGQFSSLFANRIAPEIADSKEIGFLDHSRNTAMIVVADGDIARNQFHVPQGYPLPLGFDQYTRRTYGNKDFLLNAISYLADESSLVSIRSRERTNRTLDLTKLNKNKLMWQVVNVAAPVLLVFVAGALLFMLRKRKYSRKPVK